MRKDEMFWEWTYEDCLPDDLDPRVYDFLYSCSVIHSGVRLFPWPHHRISELKKAD